MSQVQKNQMRKRGGHCKRGEVQSSIIELILENNGSVREPDIRKYLGEKHYTSDQGGINKHLHELEEKGYIELIAPKKSFRTQRHGLTNQWDIKKIECLQNIRKKFPEIRLNKYEKSLLILLYESGYKTDYNLISFDSFKFYIRLLLSPSFFDMCIEKGFQSQYSKTWEIYLYNSGSELNRIIEECINECYVSYMGSNPSSEMTKKRFIETMEEIFFKIWEETFPGWLKEAPRYMDLKIMEGMKEKKFEILGEMLKACEEKFPGWLKETPREIYLNFVRLLDKEGVDSGQRFIDETMAEINEKKYNEFQGEDFTELAKLIETSIKTFNDDLIKYRIIENSVISMKNRFFNFLLLRFDVLFEHYFCQDVLNDVASYDEREFAIATRQSREEYASISSKSNNKKDAFKKMVTVDLKQASKIIAKYKQPSLFRKVYNNPESVYLLLENLFLNKRN